MRENNDENVEALRAYYESTLNVVGSLMGVPVDQQEKDALWAMVAVRAIQELHSGAAKLLVSAPLTANIPSDIQISLVNLANHIKSSLKALDAEVARLFPELFPEA